MRKLQKTLKIIVVNLALLAVLIEAASIAVDFVQTGSFFYCQSGCQNYELAYA